MRKLIGSLLFTGLIVVSCLESTFWMTSSLRVEAAQENQEDYVIEAGVLLEYRGNAAEVIIPNGVVKIGERAFYRNKVITSVLLPTSTREIGKEAFMSSGLEKINLDSVETIREGAFRDCCCLKKAELKKLKLIEDMAFFDCSDLEEVVGMENLEMLEGNPFTLSKKWLEYGLHPGEGAFWVCNSVLLGSRSCSGKVVIPEEVTEIANYAFSGSKITSIMIPDSVLRIGKSAFEGCYKLKTVRMEDSVIELGERAFTDCIQLKDIRLSNHIQEIPTECFDNCRSLENLTLPEDVTSIKRYAFSNCCLKYFTAPFGLVEWEHGIGELYGTTLLVTEQEKNTFLRGYAAACEWQIEAAALESTKLTLSVGEKYELRFKGATKADWKSSNKTVATVGRTGNIYAKKAGKTVITATIYGKEYTCAVTVQ